MSENIWVLKLALEDIGNLLGCGDNESAAQAIARWREQLAQAECERDEWKAKALDVETHPVVVALRAQLAQAERQRSAAQEQVEIMLPVLRFYAKREHWMPIVETGESSHLIAHGFHFDGTSNGWVEAEAALRAALAATEPKPGR